MSRVSVLVAAYNAAEWLPECLDSLLEQTLHDIQIICVDDASQDSTSTILADYAARDSRIKVLSSTVNAGQAVSRNKALEYADGDYVAMVDADDKLSADALEKAVEKLDGDRSNDCVLFRLKYFDADGPQEDYPLRSHKTEWTGQEAFELSLDWSLHGLYVARIELYAAWPFDTTCRLYSDDNTTRMHYLHSCRVASCDGIYWYRRHPESMTNAVSVHRLELIEANSSMARQLRVEKQPTEVLARFERERWINLVGICGFWLKHKEILPETDAMDRFRTVYTDIDRRLLPTGLKMKLGYWPCRNFDGFWKQVKIYFRLRGIIGR